MTPYILMLGGGLLLFVVGVFLAERYARRRGRPLRSAGLVLGVLLLAVAFQARAYVAAVPLAVLLLLWVVGRTGVAVGVLVTAGLVLAAWMPLGASLASLILVGAFLGRVTAGVASGGLARAIRAGSPRRARAPGEVETGPLDPLSSLSTSEQLVRHHLHPERPRGYGF